MTAKAPDDVQPPAAARVEEEALRIWTGLDAKTLEAEFVNIIGHKVVLKDSRGKIRGIPLDQISEDDRCKRPVLGCLLIDVDMGYWK